MRIERIPFGCVNASMTLSVAGLGPKTVDIEHVVDPRRVTEAEAGEA
ncbi:hypothetical protein [Halorubrum sp. 48-1-W]|nr:hypothetical protein [Halorubrum sp. 48-1-W]